MNSRFLTTLSVIISVIALCLAIVSKTIWAVGYDIRNCPGCVPKIDWSKEKTAAVVGDDQVKSFNEDGMILLSGVLDIEKVKDLAKEVDGLSNTFMSDILVKGTLPYARYEHHIDTRSELVRDWALHGPLGKWAAELLNVESIRLYNAEAIYHAGEDSTKPCRPAWHRDTIAAPFPTNVQSVTFNVYFDDIGPDAPNGDGLIYMKGSHKDLSTPPLDPEILEPHIKVGDVLAHDAHTYHTTSGRGCWKRRSLQFRYVATVDDKGEPTRFSFGMNRFPHGPIPWSLAQATELFPHGLEDGDILAGPGYPLVYPKPIESEHAPLTGNLWSIYKLIKMMTESQKKSLEEDGSVVEGYFFLDGPVTNKSSWAMVDNPELGVAMALHKNGPTYKRLQQKH